MARAQAMGRTSLPQSRFNLPGRYAWAAAELVGPLNMLFIVYTLPALPRSADGEDGFNLGFHIPSTLPSSSTTTPSSLNTSLLGTGMPFLYHELMVLLYLLHYLNRAIITPLFIAPSMSPIAVNVAISMAVFQFINSSCLASWIVYHPQHQPQGESSVSSLFSHKSSSPSPSISLVPLLTGLFIFFLGLWGNISAENTLFRLRRAAAQRLAKSQGKPMHPSQLSYEKVYVIPDSEEAWFRHIMFPHYAMEWVEWAGYWIIGGSAGMGWGLGVGIGGATRTEMEAHHRANLGSPALWFLINEIAAMAPRAVDGLRWYHKRFGKERVARRKAIVPGLL